MHVVQVPPAPFALSARVTVHAVTAATDNYCWLLADSETGDVVVVDGPEAAPVLKFVESRGWRLVSIWNTHTHGDHIGINQELLASKLTVVGPLGCPGLTRLVDEGDRIPFADVEALVWRTEGHLKGHLSFVLPGAVFCGDTLFAGGCGYLFGGDAPAMFRSLMRLASLPPETRVCCAHEYTWDNLKFAWSVEPENRALAERIRSVRALRAEGRGEVPSTIALEQATNPFLRPGSPEIRARVAGASFEAVFAATRAWKDQKEYRSIEDDAMPGE